MTSRLPREKIQKDLLTEVSYYKSKVSLNLTFLFQNHPLKAIFDYELQSMKESGLIHRITSKYKHISMAEAECDDNGGQVPLGITNTFVPFGMLSMGAGISLAMAAAESIFKWLGYVGEKFKDLDDRKLMRKCVDVLQNQDEMTTAKEKLLEVKNLLADMKEPS